MKISDVRFPPMQNPVVPIWVQKTATFLRSRRATFIAGFVGGVLLLASIVYYVLLIRRDPSWGIGTDYNLYFKTAQTILHGLPLYVPPPTSEVSVWYGTNTVYDAYSYPPAFAEALVPLTSLDYIVSHRVWLLFCVALLTASITLLLRGFGFKAPWGWIILALGVVNVSVMVRSDVYHGQVNFLMLFLFTTGMWLLTRQRKIAAGLLWGFLPIVKPFFGIFFIYLLWRREWKAALAMAVTAGLGMLVSFVPLVLAHGFDDVRGWLSASSYDSNAPFATRPDNFALHDMFLRLFVTNPYTIPWVNSPIFASLCDLLSIAGCVLLIVLVIPARRLADYDPAVVMAETGLILGVTLIYGPLTEGDHLMLLLPAFVGVLWLSYRALRANAKRYSWLFLAAVWIAFFMYTFAPFKVGIGLKGGADWQPVGGLRILLIQQPAFLLIIAVLGLAWVLYRQKREVQPQSATPLSTQV